MSSKYNGIMNSLWMLLFLAILNPIRQSYIEGLQTVDKNSFGPRLKGTVKTIEALECGDIIDCVDIYQQPAFHDPLIKDLKMHPGSFPSGFNKTRNHQPKLIQTWRKYGECPNGTVPIRRTLDNNSTIRLRNDDPSNREYAAVHQFFNKGHGARANFNVWNPRLETSREMSLSQLWISAGDGQHLNTVEAGWMVHPVLYHDARTRLFAYWTSDNYDKTGCFNTICPGFVQTTNKIALGAALEPLSVYDHEAVVLEIGLARIAEGDWWLRVEDDLLGYFEHSRFTTLVDGADEIAFGGEIINLKEGHRHTSTTMGSGHFSREGFKKSSFISNIEVGNENFEWVEPNLQIQGITNSGCYDLSFGPPGTHLGSHFYFGGPGFSQRCQ